MCKGNNIFSLTIIGCASRIFDMAQIGHLQSNPYVLHCKTKKKYCEAVTVCFLKYLPWQAMHFLQRSTHFLKMCCRPFAASFRRIVEQAVLTFHIHFSLSKALLLLENHSSSYCIASIGFMDEL